MSLISARLADGPRWLLRPGRSRSRTGSETSRSSFPSRPGKGRGGPLSTVLQGSASDRTANPRFPDRPGPSTEIYARGARPQDGHATSVFRYNAAPVSSPNYKARSRIATPTSTRRIPPPGALITGDFSPSHPHHRGFFLAYERTKTGDLTPDFWNIHVGTGKIHADGFESRSSGRSPPGSRPGTLGGEGQGHRQGDRRPPRALGRRGYDIPGAPYWLFDLTSTQQAVDRPLEVLPYRYGGMAYRGPEPFVKGTLDVLTSEGKHRKDGDQKPARWVDLTGPIADGSDKYAGAMIADHPVQPALPECRADSPDDLAVLQLRAGLRQAVTIAVDAPTVFRYRVLIHDGHPDAEARRAGRPRLRRAAEVSVVVE